MTEARDLGCEIELDRVEPMVVAALAQHARAHWERATRGDDSAPPWPVLGGVGLWRVVARAWRDADNPILRRRAAVLARWIGLVWVEGDASVCVAAAALRGQAGRADAAALTTLLSALAAARNGAARKLGFASVVALWLAFEELEEAQLADWLAAPSMPPLDQGASRAGADGARGCDVAVVVFPEDTVARLVAKLGVPPTVRVTVDRSGTGLARTFVIAPPDDVRVVWSPGGSNALARLAHELGHALYASQWRGLPPALAAPASRFVDEGVAEWAADAVAPDAGSRASWLRWQRARAAAELALYAADGAAAMAAYRGVSARQLGGPRELAADAHLIEQLAADPGAQLAYLGGNAVRVTISENSPHWLFQRLAAGAMLPPGRWLSG